jgi:hypothetical protein
VVGGRGAQYRAGAGPRALGQSRAVASTSQDESRQRGDLILDRPQAIPNPADDRPLRPSAPAQRVLADRLDGSHRRAGGKACAKRGMPALALTDDSNVFALLKFFKECERKPACSRSPAPMSGCRMSEDPARLTCCVPIARATAICASCSAAPTHKAANWTGRCFSATGSAGHTRRPGCAVRRHGRRDRAPAAGRARGDRGAAAAALDALVPGCFLPGTVALRAPAGRRADAGHWRNWPGQGRLPGGGDQ